MIASVEGICQPSIPPNEILFPIKPGTRVLAAIMVIS